MFLLAAMIVGCGGPKTVPVAGVVTIDGQPLTRGYIFVMPENQRAAGGEIDAQGRFKLTTYDEGDGCYLGTHQVTVTSTEALSQTSTKHLIPPHYAQPTTSKTTVTIDGPTENLKIELTWNGGKPYIERIEGQGDVAPIVGTDAEPEAGQTP